MKCIKIAFFFLLPSSALFAEEGMLIPSVIEAFESDMKAMGMKLSAKDIYSVNTSSLKDAVLHFNGGCTAELVSSKGLLLTNHHCGYSQIQSHSSLEKDYLKNGFWAKNLKEELPNPNLYAARMVRIEDVTKTIFLGITVGMSTEEKNLKIRKNMEILIADATRDSGLKAEIKAFNYGNDYYMIVKEVFNDVRLVGTPPNSVGKFGGDTDNWVWPRHTGDFSVFRVYAGADNKPADYNANNIPYSPLHFLPIAMTPRKEGDFTMVYGFPGTTEQHLVSAQLKFIMDKERPARIAMREKSLSVIDAAMRSSDQIRIQYSSKQARIANAYKKWIGQVDGLIELDAIRVKESYEKAYQDKAMSSPEWKSAYGNVITEMKNVAQQAERFDFEYAMAVEYLFVGPEVFAQARSFMSLFDNFEKYKENGEWEKRVAQLEEGLDGFFKNFDKKVDQGIFELLTIEYMNQIGKEYVPKLMSSTSLEKLVKAMYKKSFLADLNKSKAILRNLDERTLKSITADPGIRIYRSLMAQLTEKTLPLVRKYGGEMDELLKTYVKGKYEMFPDAKHWADANGTLRVSYGKLEGSAPVDGMRYTEHTTTDGILQKHRSGNPDFELLPDLLELYKKRDFGSYAQDGDLWVCFSGSNHTTGGNSGSPVIDAKGRLMGLNFDRSWESTMSDYMFDPDRCRNIVVDIRYVLWVIDKYGKASHLVDEMNIQTDGI